jgi:4-hydroxy-2-oxoheptanedioate aldolase
MKPNKFRELLKAGKPTLATHLHSTWPGMVEAVGYTGVFDYIEFVCEYAPFDLYALDNICRACELFGMGAMIKVDQSLNTFLAQRGIGAGFQSVLFADSRTAEDVRLAIRACRPETPEGKGRNGVATRRMAYMGYGDSPAYVQALQDIVVGIMIEKKGAVEALDEILEVPGIDMIQWGPGDYSMSIGRPGQGKSPDIKAIEKRVIDASMKKGIPPRAEIATPDQAKYYLDMGIRHFCMGTDLLTLHQWMKDNGEEMRKALEGK